RQAPRCVTLADDALQSLVGAYRVGTCSTTAGATPAAPGFAGGRSELVSGSARDPGLGVLGELRRRLRRGERRLRVRRCVRLQLGVVRRGARGVLGVRG